MRVCEPRTVHRRARLPLLWSDRGLLPSLGRSPHNAEYIAQDAATRGFTSPGTLFAPTAHEPSEVHHGGSKPITGESEADEAQRGGNAPTWDEER